MASKALRVLAMAQNSAGDLEHPAPDKDEQGLVFCGLVGMMNPPRAEAIEAVGLCKTAGIHLL